MYKTQPCSTKPCRIYSLSKVGRPGMVLRMNQLTARSYITARMCLYDYIWLSQILYVLSRLYHASRPLQKGGSSVPPSTDFETMASHDAGVVYFTEYLSVLFQLTYLNENVTKLLSHA